VTDPDLDDAAAVSIMGWICRRVPWAYDDSAELWHDADAVPLLTRHAWSPSEDHAQCMQVVEAMLERGFRLRLEWGNDGASACFESASGAGTPCRETDPRRAILRAALDVLTRPTATGSVAP
jgi:hypothetical protein